jgi:hypothetical protein
MGVRVCAFTHANTGRLKVNNTKNIQCGSTIVFQPLLNSFSPRWIFFQEITVIICRDDYTTAFSSILHYEPTTGTQTLCSTIQVQVPFLYKDIMLYITTVSLVSSHHLV